MSHEGTRRLIARAVGVLALFSLSCRADQEIAQIRSDVGDAGVVVLPRSIAIGLGHTCVVHAGHVYCVGMNEYGELGNGSTIPSVNDAGATVPVEVTGLSDVVVVEVAAGDAHSCAREIDGRVWCWGDDVYGQLGDGTQTSSAVPVLVAGLTDAIGLSAARDGTCAIGRAGDVVCWGGAGGDGTEDSHSVPTPIAHVEGETELNDAIKLTGGADHWCVLRRSGGVACWGENPLGVSGAPTELGPVSVPGIDDAVDVAAGWRFTVVARRSGQVWSWSSSEEAPGSAVLDVGGSAPIGDAVEVAAGENFACARRSMGSVACWGVGYTGSLGDGEVHTTNWNPAVEVLDLDDAEALAAGRGFTVCARSTLRGIVCWGDRSAGQLSDGYVPSPQSPVEAQDVDGPIDDALHVSTNEGGTCAIREDHSVGCWGWERPFGGVTTVSGLSADSVSVGVWHVCALRQSTGGVACWGENGSGQLGDGTTTRSDTPTDVLVETDPAPIPLLGATGAVVGTFSHACAITPENVYCWGLNNNGQLGDNTQIDRHVATLVAGPPLAGATQLALGTAHSCALVSGEVWCWGRNLDCGDGSGCPLENRLLPVKVPDIADAVAIAAAHAMTCILRDGGNSVTCFGDNRFEQAPRAMVLPTPAIRIVAGRFHTCVLHGGGMASCFGHGRRGELGDGRFTGRADPVPSPAVGATELAVGTGQTASHTCYVAADRHVYCWGFRGAALFGDGVPWFQTAPTEFLGLP